MNEQIKKGKEAEAYIASLAENIFIGHWCYPNPIDEMGDRKEICDLLILFKKTCIICQIKNYDFKGDYARYFRKTLDKAADQIDGAERKLFRLDRDIYIKHPANGVLKFPRDQFTQILRLIIHVGKDMNINEMSRRTKGGEFIHVFDKADFEHLLGELSTIADLTEYLDFRLALITKINVAVYGRDRDLLALYLRIGSRLHQYIEKNQGQHILFDLDNSWESFAADRQQSFPYENDLRHIETLLYKTVQKELAVNQHTKQVAEDLWSLNRHERRVFCCSLLEFMQKFMHRGYNRIIRRSTVFGGHGIILFYYPEIYNEEELMWLAMIAADGYCDYLEYEVTNMIVFAITEQQPIKIMPMDCSHLRHENPEQLHLILKELGWFETENMGHFQISFNRKDSSTTPVTTPSSK